MGPRWGRGGVSSAGAPRLPRRVSPAHFGMRQADETAPAADPTVFGEADVLRHLRRNRWLSITTPDGYKLFAMNWVVTVIASVGLWAFIIWSATVRGEWGTGWGKRCVTSERGLAQRRSPARGRIPTGCSRTGVARRSRGCRRTLPGFVRACRLPSALSSRVAVATLTLRPACILTDIITQDVWGIIIFWLAFSKHGSLKFGGDDEKPRFTDLAWFSMLFTCGLGIGMFPPVRIAPSLHPAASTLLALDRLLLLWGERAALLLPSAPRLGR